MKKKNHRPKLALQKIAILRLDQDKQTSVLGGATANSTCCGTLPGGQRQTTCCSLASCPPLIC